MASSPERGLSAPTVPISRSAPVPSRPVMMMPLFVAESLCTKFHWEVNFNGLFGYYQVPDQSFCSTKNVQYRERDLDYTIGALQKCKELRALN
ncbi:hypothetical protein EVAR_96914_1 [Eumeta japonica]|uniref:Uncharacterized protein n=1 Tax=Eumeta variegata TaxID=151549 RepID=A0A4C1WD13_EUMVA|nr:hypothetical protein EVAR_96914_1 [Eumeta japonica]